MKREINIRTTKPKLSLTLNGFLSIRIFSNTPRRNFQFHSIYIKKLVRILETEKDKNWGGEGENAKDTNLFVDIWVEFESQFPICSLDFIGGCRGRNAQDIVWRFLEARSQKGSLPLVSLSRGRIPEAMEVWGAERKLETKPMGMTTSWY